MQVGQLADIVSQMQLLGSGNISSQTILNSKGGGVGIVTLRSVAPQSSLRPVDAETEPGADSRVQQSARSVPLPFPSWVVPTRRSEMDEDLLNLFRKVEINIPLLNAIKQVPKYTKFLKELCVHKRKKMKGAFKTGEIMSTLIKHENANVGVQGILPKKCQDSSIFPMPCTISSCTFVDAMLDIGASINVMPTSVYRSVVQPLGVLEDVLVQVNELIFPTDFYVLDMEDEAFRKGSILILG
ncbi:hypothetical protein CR513_61704, partial [Mucuna pruriens]